MHERVSRHAQDRAAERLGRPPSRSEWRLVLWAILEREAPLLRACDGGEEIYLVRLGDLAFRVVWVPDTASVKTILPPYAWRPERKSSRTGPHVRGRAEPRRGGAMGWGGE